MKRVRVPLGARAYDIQVGIGLLPQLGSACQRLALGQRCAVVSDSRVAPLHAAATMNALAAAGFAPVLVTVPAGEKAKSLHEVSRGCEALAAHRLERRSFLVALGGGVVGDLTGFLAATYLRGIPFVQVPTTLLAQVDSSVGGKTGVNLKAGKNLVGAFHQPRLVLCDLDTLATLPDREFRSGLAEVIKYGVIEDAALFRRLERDLDKLLRHDAVSLTAVIARCCAIKARVVGQDETEGGRRAILNFGHTMGHALEAISGYGKYLHGEAIAIGQVLAAELSAAQLGLPWKDVERLERLLVRAGLPTRVPLTPRQRARLGDAMRLDKKVSRGEVTFVLAEAIGQVRWGQRVPDALLGQVLTGTLRRPPSPSA